MAEWSIAAVLKTVVLRGTGGSNPSLSARQKRRHDASLLVICLFSFVLQGCLQTDLGHWGKLLQARRSPNPSLPFLFFNHFYFFQPYAPLRPLYLLVFAPVVPDDYRLITGILPVYCYNFTLPKRNKIYIFLHFFAEIFADSKKKLYLCGVFHVRARNARACVQKCAK